MLWLPHRYSTESLHSVRNLAKTIGLQPVFIETGVCPQLQPLLYLLKIEFHNFPSTHCLRVVTWYSEIVEIVTYFFRQASSRVVCPWQLVMNHLASSAGKFRRANLSWCGSHLVSLWFYIMREKVCVSPSQSGFLSPPWLSPLLFSCLHQNKQTAVQTAEWLVCQAHGMSYMTISERVTETNSICFKSDSSLVL